MGFDKYIGKRTIQSYFLEPATHRRAILSAVDPDGFASQFGYHAKEDDFSDGLDVLLENQGWKERGECGYGYFRETFELNRAVDQYIFVCGQILAS